jgi:hypothetical protein
MDKILALIPEIYYDIIARIIPGIIFILLIIPSNSWELISQEDILTNSALLLFLVSGYTCGFVLDACSALFERMWDGGRLWSKLDEIEDKDKAGRPIKLVAEVAQLRVLFLGWLIAGFRLEPLVFIPGKFFRVPYLLVYVIVAAILFYLYYRWYQGTKTRLNEILKPNEGNESV